MSSDKYNELRDLQRVVELISELDPFMTMTRLNTFLKFASDNDVNSIQDLREYLVKRSDGISNSAVTRNVSYWLPQRQAKNKKTGDRLEGLHYLDAAPDLNDMRRKNLSFTQGGRDFCRKIKDTLKV